MVDRNDEMVIGQAQTLGAVTNRRACGCIYLHDNQSLLELPCEAANEISESAHKDTIAFHGMKRLSEQAIDRVEQIGHHLLNQTEDPTMNWPKLPAKAAYLTLNNPNRRNALSLNVLRDLRDQLHKYNTSPTDGKLRILPPFNPNILQKLEAAHEGSDPQAAAEYDWLLDGAKWREVRKGLPNVIVLRSDGPVFSAGHDLSELRQLPHHEVKETFAICAEVMTLIRRSPAVVVAHIQGLATAAGCQLALATDFPIAAASTQFRLPGASMGLPCTSPSTAVSRRVGNALTYRMLALAEPVRADYLPGGAVEVVADDTALEKRVAEIVEKLANDTPAQPGALGKWAYWTQVGFQGDSGSGSDGFEDAVAWTGRMMALHARSDDAREGMQAFTEKRKPQWKT